MLHFEIEVERAVYATVRVEAASEKEARKKVQHGAGYWHEAEFQRHTAPPTTILAVRKLDKG